MQQISRHEAGDSVLTYLLHHITYAQNKSLNSPTEKVKRMTSEYLNHMHFRIAIYFHYAEVGRYPQ